ncbi:RES family NAD+ phosphorylase [Erwinia sp. PsM31]|jgi:hypothetical protein|uniref:RES family NAD+ phosphorylase n=1 Tax=Erwinia sp. PsM31 TaxID=3030535 RepID=UPI00263AE1F6|nr:RES family NAD+ phosphorylase [Erwinia sp. PsM31]MDN4625617.1 RES family NAD+ phosphorylase [Erwinia sp. PsM31]
MADREAITRKLKPPKSDLAVNLTVWEAGKRIYRIHSAAFRAAQFNPGKGSARFSPMINGVATLYGGVSTAVAVMETLFHDLPPDSSGAPYDLARLYGKVHSVIEPRVDLNLVDLNPKTLRKMGVNRASLLDSTADQYIYTREYSLAIYQACPQAHGLQWSSRQHGDTALMLFNDRVKAEQLYTEVESERILDSDSVMTVIELEADQLGIVLLESGG